ncbi:BURP domain-containing protein 11 [Populus alba x Populus x berolinensis]|uniref:BURP domain-containing protein 11 n=1 Tax=Populus alba x Populus x berolinensis TaxID=444605 RepID=A0AAD6R2N8_9ROSI|nr:BURP domain-containing protein 11 [Populus alba x Populus x berolinensis]
MGVDVLSWRLILCSLLVLLFAKDSSARKMTHTRWREVSDDDTNGLQHNREPDLQQLSKDDHLLTRHSRGGGDHRNHEHGHLSSHMNHMDPSDKIFFTIKDLQVGKTLPIYFYYRDPSTSPHLISREEANSIPFSLAELPYLLEFFSLSKESPQAKAMEYTLTQCELELMEGETKFCATSLESMLDFAQATFGSETQVKALTTNHLRKPVVPIQNYTIVEEPREILVPKVLEVTLEGENGDGGGCCCLPRMHLPGILPFQLLGMKPGTCPVCHFFSPRNLLWVPVPISTM